MSARPEDVIAGVLTIPGGGLLSKAILAALHAAGFVVVPVAQPEGLRPARHINQVGSQTGAAGCIWHHAVSADSQTSHPAFPEDSGILPLTVPPDSGNMPSSARETRR